MFEVKLNQIHKTHRGTEITCSLYRTISVDDRYDRTLITKLTQLFPSGITKQDVVVWLKNKMKEINQERNLSFAVSDIYVSIENQDI